MADPVTIYEDITRRLHGLRRKIKRLHLVYSVPVFCSVELVLITAAALIEHSLWLAPSARRVLLLLLICGAAAALIIILLLPLADFFLRKSTPSDNRLALLIGSRFPEIRDRLANSLDVYRNADRDTSPELAARALQAAARETERIRFNDAVSPKEQYYRLKMAAGLGGAVLLVWLFLGSGLLQALQRIVSPGSVFPRPSAYHLMVAPADTLVMEGAAVDIRVGVTGRLPDALSLSVKSGDRPAQQHLLGPDRRFTLTGIKMPLDYHIRCGADETPWYHIGVIEYPKIRTMQISLIPPAYSRQPERTIARDEGNITALKGSRLHLRAETNKPAAEAHLQFSSGRRERLRIAGTVLSADFRCRQTESYHFLLLDSLGNTNRSPVSYTITMRQDLPPVADIESPAMNIDLDESMTVPLTLTAEDDFGLSRLAIRYRVQSRSGADTTLQRVPIPADLADEPAYQNVTYTWQMEEMHLLPEDVVTYQFEAWDNDRVSGPKSGLSAANTIRFPSIEEILGDVDRDHRRQTQDLSAIADQGRELQRQLTRATDALKAGRELQWEQQRNLKNALHDQQQTLSGMDSLQTRLEKIVDTLDKQDLLGLETLEKYQEMQQLYSDIASPELEKAMQTLQQALEQLDPEAVRKAAERMQDQQQQLIDSLDRTIQLLKQLRIEQQLESLIGQTAAMLREQTDINETLSAAESADLNRTADREEQLADDAAFMEESLNQLSKDISTLDNISPGLLDPALQQLHRGNLDSLAAAVSEQIRKSDRSTALSGGTKIAGRLDRLQRMLEDARSGMQAASDGQSTDAARRTAKRLLALSLAQEDLADKTAAGKIDLQENARRQWSLKHSLEIEADSLAALTMKAFFLDPGVAGSLHEAITVMDKAVTLISQENRPAADLQRKAMALLNRTVVLMLRSLEQMARNSGQTGMSAMDQLMQGLEQTSVEQMALNQQTLDMLNQGMLTQAQQAAMSRLAAGQETLRKTLEGLMREFGERQDMLGSLDRIIDDMKEAEELLRSRDGDSELVHRQQQILSRLLDAQHALRTEDISRRRRAISGRNMTQPSPPSLKPRSDDIRRLLEQDILRLSKEGFTEDYMELIRRYFRSLAREQKTLQQLREKQQ